MPAVLHPLCDALDCFYCVLPLRISFGVCLPSSLAHIIQTTFATVNSALLSTAAVQSHYQCYLLLLVVNTATQLLLLVCFFALGHGIFSSTCDGH